MSKLYGNLRLALLFSTGKKCKHACIQGGPVLLLPSDLKPGKMGSESRKSGFRRAAFITKEGLV